jgi:hypothetical protein
MVNALTEATGYCRSMLKAYLPHMNHELNNYLYNVKSRPVVFTYASRGRRRDVPGPEEDDQGTAFQLVDTKALKRAAKQLGLPTPELLVTFADYIATLSQVLSLYEILQNYLPTIHAICQETMYKKHLEDMTKFVRRSS